MTRRGLIRAGWALAALLIVVELLLLLTGRRVLISQRFVAAGERYIVEGYGQAGSASNAALVCRYFTGRNVVATVFWYSPNNILGRDECPTILSRDE